LEELGSGALDKMRVELSAPVNYTLPLGKTELPLNPLIGERLRIEFLGVISCANCGRHTRRSFAQGYCFPCFKRLARCDSCIVKPETCHFHQGTCREPEWAQQFCMSDHLVYLANSSGIKVGITRVNQVPTRWIDQGATQARAVLRVATRQVSGFAEILFGESVADKTNWRAMLKASAEPRDLAVEAAMLLERHRQGLDNLRIRFGADAITVLENPATVTIDYPVREYPGKPVSLNLDKTPLIEDILVGIKGQYLIFDHGVLNVRNFSSYHVRVCA
jgi:hypothetical protein